MGGVKRFLVGPNERASLPVTLVDSAGALVERLPHPVVAGELLVGATGALVWMIPASGMTFTPTGAADFGGPREQAVVLAPEEDAEVGGVYGWVGSRNRRCLASTVELGRPAPSDDRAVFRYQSAHAWSGSPWELLAAEDWGHRHDTVWDVFAFVRHLQRRRAEAGFAPGDWRGLTRGT
jgi:hypothetical protein